MILLVEGHRGPKEAIDHVGVVVKLLVHHEGQNAHLGSTTVVELDGLLLDEGGLVPSRSLKEKKTSGTRHKKKTVS